MTVCVAGMIDVPGRGRPHAEPVQRHLDRLHRQPEHQRQLPDGLPVLPGQLRRAVRGGRVPLPGRLRVRHEHHRLRHDGIHAGCCVPDACAQITCPPGFNCQLDANGNAQLHRSVHQRHLPADATSASSARASTARAVRRAAPTGRSASRPTATCSPASPIRAPTSCATRDQFCQNGACVGACAGPCPKGQFCDEGQCVADPCAHTPCVEGQVCRVDQRRRRLRREPVPVRLQHRPGLLRRRVRRRRLREPALPGGHALRARRRTARATCETNPASPKDQIVGAGGGGFGCAVAGQPRATSSSLAWLLIVAGALLFRRRRAAEVRSMKKLLLARSLLVAGGGRLQVEPVLPQLQGLGQRRHHARGHGPSCRRRRRRRRGRLWPRHDRLSGGPCVPTNGGIEICDGLDNDCNGTIDDVAAVAARRRSQELRRLRQRVQLPARVRPVRRRLRRRHADVQGERLPARLHRSRRRSDQRLRVRVHADDAGDRNLRRQGQQLRRPGRRRLHHDLVRHGQADAEVRQGRSTTAASAASSATSAPGTVMACQGTGTNGRGQCAVVACVNAIDSNGMHQTYRHNPAAGNINVTGCEYHCPSRRRRPATTATPTAPAPSPPRRATASTTTATSCADDNLTDPGLGGACPDGAPGKLCSAAGASATCGRASARPARSPASAAA